MGKENAFEKHKVSITLHAYMYYILHVSLHTITNVYTHVYNMQP